MEAEVLFPGSSEVADPIVLDLLDSMVEAHESFGNVDPIDLVAALVDLDFELDFAEVDLEGVLEAMEEVRKLLELEY